MKPIHRKFAAILTVASLLFTQWAVAAYACPMARIASTVQIEQDSTPPCHRQAGGDSGLCQAHCQQGQQTAGEHSASPPIADFVPSYTMVLRTTTPVFPPSALTSAELVHATSPPATIRNCCFRI